MQTGNIFTNTESSVPLCWSTQPSHTHTQSHTKRQAFSPPTYTQTPTLVCSTQRTFHSTHISHTQHATSTHQQKPVRFSVPVQPPQCTPLSKPRQMSREMHKHIHQHTDSSHTTIRMTKIQIGAKRICRYAEIDTNSSHVAPITNLSTRLQTQAVLGAGGGSPIVEPLPTCPRAGHFRA